MVGHVIDEETSRRALADQTSVPIGEPHDHRVDRTRRDAGEQIVTCDDGPLHHAGTLPNPSRPP
jgi:hypothetical protein